MSELSPLGLAALSIAKKKPVFPCKPKGKAPLTPHGFHDATQDPGQISEWWERWPEANLATPTGSGLVVLDVDPRNGGDESFYRLQEEHGRVPDTLSSRTGGGGQHFFFKSDAEVRCGPLNGYDGLDIKGEGGYILVPPSETEGKYSWDRPGIKPAICPNWLRKLAASSRSLRASELSDPISQGHRNDTLASLAGTMRRRGASQLAILAALREENSARCRPPLAEAELEIIAASISRYEPSVRTNGRPGRMKSSSPRVNLLGEGIGFNDAGNATRFALMSGQMFRYCFDYKSWLYFDGCRWVHDKRGKATQAAKNTLIEVLRQASNVRDKDFRESCEKHARKSLSAYRIKSMLDLARSELPVSPDELDQDPYALNCPNGTVDLKTGSLRPHRSEDYLTKMCSVEYHPEATCPQFQEMVYMAMGGTPDASLATLDRAERLIDYLQKACGYSITGEVSEKAVFCLFGSGNNSKTTFLEAVRYPIAEYSQQILIDSLMTHRFESVSSQADLADLKGARLVTTSEGEQNQQLAAGRLKFLTQGMGSVRAVRKYENPISFPATHKLWMDSNFRPVVNANDAALWARLKCIPFETIIPPEQQEKKLLEKLKGEAKGILAWIVEGCLRWQKDGLGDPPEVTESGRQWREENDPLKEFLDDCCELGPGLKCGATDLFQKYQSWATRWGIRDTLARNAFKKTLEVRGFKYGSPRTGGKQKRGWTGIGLRMEEL